MSETNGQSYMLCTVNGAEGDDLIIDKVVAEQGMYYSKEVVNRFRNGNPDDLVLGWGYSHYYQHVMPLRDEAERESALAQLYMGAGDLVPVCDCCGQWDCHYMD